MVLQNTMNRLLLILLLVSLSFTSIKADPVIPPPPFDLFLRIVKIMQDQESVNILLQTSADKTLKLRIKKDYEIFDSKGKLVLKGSGKEINISELAEGKYTIKFDKDYNQIEYFKKV